MLIFVTVKEDLPKIADIGAKFAKYVPEWKGPISVEESVIAVIGVVEGAPMEKNGGIMVSHWGGTRTGFELEAS
jgi:hypothetical protein